MGLHISCDFCGRELVYSKGWNHSQDDRIACLNCWNIMGSLVELDGLNKSLVTAQMLIGDKNSEFGKLTNDAQVLCKSLMNAIEQMMLIESPIL